MKAQSSQRLKYLKNLCALAPLWQKKIKTNENIQIGF